jgi:rfaE bifunctional protein nucleotidyltransferase chain/domain
MKKNEILKNKILELNGLEKMLAIDRFLGKKIVFTNGCFDIIHRGHIEYLSKAADLGEILVIGLNSDSSVHKLKGKDRPVQDQITRAEVLASMFFVTYIAIFDEETPYNLIKTVQPDFLVKGGDYNIKEIVGYDIVTNKGGQVLTIPFVEGFSTTSIINKVQG